MAKRRPSRIPIPFVGPSYQSASLSIDAQQTVNFFIEVDNAGGRAALSLIGRWGMDAFATLSAFGIRGAIALGNVGYVVSGKTFYVLNNDGTNTPYAGVITTEAGTVGITTNGLQVMVTDGINGYIYDIAAKTFVKIVSAGFLGAIDVTYVDGYFVVVNPNSKNAQCSALLDGTSWDALNVGAVEGDSDNLMRAIAVHGDLWMLKQNSCEVFYDAALAVGFPFVRMQGAYLNTGLAAQWGAVPVGNTLFWVARNREGYKGIMRADGYTPTKISSPGVDTAISSYASISDCIAWTFADRGHTFIMFTFPSAGKTWMFDPSVASHLGIEHAWSELRSYGVGYYKCAYHIYLNNQHLLGDMTTGKLYKVNWNTFTDAGDAIEGIRTTQHLHGGGVPLGVNRLEVQMEKGVGVPGSGNPAAPNQGENPLAVLTVSKDGGKTWGNAVEASMGALGQYGYGVAWNRLGMGMNWTFRLRITDPVKRVIMGAFADIEGGLD